MQILEQKPLRELAQKYTRRMRKLMPMLTFSYDAALMTAQYRENGQLYKERLVAVIENWGQAGAGMWGNKETFFIRAPAGRFGNWEATFSIIQNSVQINPKWLNAEVRAQAQRGEVVLNTQRETQRIGREITEHRQLTNAEIHNDMFLTLMDQEEYVNPYTKEVEVGSNQWRFRWVNESGDVIYADSEEYDPNQDLRLRRTDFKKTPVRKRFPN